MSHSEYAEKIYTALIIYDIIDDKKRNRMAKFLESYGVRVQKSAFEARLTRKNFDFMLRRAANLIDVTKDSLRVYLLPSKTDIHSFGADVTYPQETFII